MKQIISEDIKVQSMRESMDRFKEGVKKISLKENTTFTSKDNTRKIEFHQTPSGAYEYSVNEYDDVDGSWDKSRFQKIDFEWLEEEKEAMNNDFVLFLNKIKK